MQFGQGGDGKEVSLLLCPDSVPSIPIAISISISIILPNTFDYTRAITPCLTFDMLLGRMDEHRVSYRVQGK